MVSLLTLITLGLGAGLMAGGVLVRRVLRA
jgi:hypothetical protein